MKRLTIILAVVLAPLFTVAQNVGDYISDGDASGTVFYVEPATDTADGIAYIVSDDISFDGASTAWGCYGLGTEGYLEIERGYANTNTDFILESCSGESAASLVRSYGDGMWYLPTFREFEIMYLNLHTQGLGDFDGMYWMSYVSSNDHMNVCSSGDTVYYAYNCDGVVEVITNTHAYVYDFAPNIPFLTRPKTKLKTDLNNGNPFRGVRYMTIPRLITSIDKVDKKVSVYPNPTKSNINVSTPASVHSYSILDFKGSEVLSGATTMPNTLIDLSGLAKGAYIVRLLGNPEILTTRVIVR